MFVNLKTFDSHEIYMKMLQISYVASDFKTTFRPFINPDLTQN